MVPEPPPALLPVALLGAGLVIAVLAHVDLPEVDYACVVGEAVHDRVRRDLVRQLGNPVRWSGLRGNHRRQPVLPVREDREQVAGRIAVNTDSEEVVDDEQIDARELIQQLVVPGHDVNDLRG